mmetsp:Transcript_19048/g.28741  ORF Transcript_19048/g.28741 Transcript_19048/m.28741 type:complete len:99 (-) Transcript_19048:1226-1522(-)
MRCEPIAAHVCTVPSFKKIIARDGKCQHFPLICQSPTRIKFTCHLSFAYMSFISQEFGMIVNSRQQSGPILTISSVVLLTSFAIVGKPTMSWRYGSTS